MLHVCVMYTHTHTHTHTHAHAHTHTHMHAPTRISTCRHGQMKQKPVVVEDYNQHMSGVDKLDQMMAYYSFLHKSVKWWRKVFFWVLEAAVVNSYIVYKELARERDE